MNKAKKNKCANTMKKVKRLCKMFGFITGMLKDVLVEGWVKR